MNKLRLENAEVYYVTGLNRVKFRLKWGWIFVKFSLNYAEGQARSVNGNVYLGEDVGDCSNVVLVTVCYKYSADFICVFYEL